MDHKIYAEARAAWKQAYLDYQTFEDACFTKWRSGASRAPADEERLAALLHGARLKMQEMLALGHVPPAGRP